MRELNDKQEYFLKKVNHWLFFRLFLLFNLPSAWRSGVRVETFTSEGAVVSVPFKWFTKNPFRSTYFACLAMAAEMSTGLLAMLAIQGRPRPISMLVVDLKATYSKKAIGRTYFTCDAGEGMMKLVDECLEKDEAQSFKAVSIGRDQSGEEIARFEVTWSFKAKK